MTGKKLYLTGVESEKEIELVDWIGEAGGEVVSIEHKGSIGNVFSRIIFLEKNPWNMNQNKTARTILIKIILHFI